MLANIVTAMKTIAKCSIIKKKTKAKCSILNEKTSITCDNRKLIAANNSSIHFFKKTLLIFYPIGGEKAIIMMLTCWQLRKKATCPSRAITQLIFLIP